MENSQLKRSLGVDNQPLDVLAKPLVKNNDPSSVKSQGFENPGSLILGSARALAKSVHNRGPTSDLSGPAFTL